MPIGSRQGAQERNSPGRSVPELHARKRAPFRLPVTQHVSQHGYDNDAQPTEYASKISNMEPVVEPEVEMATAGGRANGPEGQTDQMAGTISEPGKRLNGVSAFLADNRPIPGY
ncbi:MAG: hypothetical protein ACK5MY_07065 [Jhaorihella sp.]